MAVGGNYSVMVDGERFEVVVRDLGSQGGERRFKVQVGGREHEVGVGAEPKGASTSASPKLDLGSVQHIEPSKVMPNRAPAPSAVAASGTIVGAPMTGKIVSVNVVEGQEVEEGDLLVVLEAMKMENSITASTGGKVSGISVAVGDNVKKGEKICVLVPGS